MIFLIFAVLISVFVLLIILSVTFSSLNSSALISSAHQLIHAPTNSISLIIPEFKNNLNKESFSTNPVINKSHQDLLKYSKTWGYSLDDTSNTNYIFYINDNIGSINLSRDLGHLINMMGNSSYIMFMDTKSFIIKRDNDSITKHPTYHDFLDQISNDTDLSDDSLRRVIGTGFPHRTKNGIILGKDYLDEILNSKHHSFKDIIVIQSSIKPKTTISNETKYKIPKVIYQTFETRALPSRFINAINTWLIRNPEYKYKYYDAGDRRNFIQKYFENRILNAYDKLIPGAYKADFWRYCVIYIKGGVYVDIKMGANRPLKDIIDPDTDMLFVNDEPDEMLYNAFFASIPRNPLLNNVIMKIVNNIETDYYGISPLFPTGPLPMGSIIIPALGYTEHLPIGKFVTSHGIVQAYSFHHVHGDRRLLHYIGSDPDNSVIKVRNSPDIHDQEFLLKITGVPNYGVLWCEKKIYRN